MTGSDLLPFRMALVDLAAAYGKTLSERQLESYWSGLDDLALPLVTDAMQRAKRESRFLPAVAVIRQAASAIRSAAPDERSGLRKPAVDGSVECALCEDTGWIPVDAETGDRLEWVALIGRATPRTAMRACGCRAANPVYRWKRAQERTHNVREA